MSLAPAVVHDGMYRVSWVDSLALPGFPSAAELEAGISLECQITPDGLGREASDESVDASRLCSLFSATQVGRSGFELALTLVRLDESSPGVVDTAYRTIRKGRRGFLVVRDSRPSVEPWENGDLIEVYPVQAGTRSKANPGPNELQTFSLPLVMTSSPLLDVTVTDMITGFGLGPFGIAPFGV